MGLCPKGLRPLEVMLVVALVKLRQMLHSPAVFYFLLYFFFPSLQCKFLVSSRFSPFLARFTFQFPHDNMGCRLSKLLGAHCALVKIPVEFLWIHFFVMCLPTFLKNFKIDPLKACKSLGLPWVASMSCMLRVQRKASAELKRQTGAASVAKCLWTSTGW